MSNLEQVFIVDRLTCYFDNTSGMLPGILSPSDEASSALDASTEQDFLQRLRWLLDNKDNNLSMVLFVTHRRTVMEACDRVAVTLGPIRIIVIFALLPFSQVLDG